MEKKSKFQNVMLAKEVAELVLRKYPKLTMYEIKTAMMSAEQILLDSIYFSRKGEDPNPFK
jgi:hypothetical protein